MEISQNNEKQLLGTKGKQLWYPTFAPHIKLGTNQSVLDEIYLKYPDSRIYVNDKQ